MKTEALEKETFELALMQFTGTTHWYLHPLAPDMAYTDGIKYFAEQSKSYWLLDIIATEYFPMLPEQPYLLITVLSHQNRGQIVVTDGNDNKLKSKHLAFTDLIEGTWRFYLTGNVLLLPSEY